MPNVFFTSDQHFGHENIINLCERPFKNAAAMETEIIKRHNEIVKPGDLVYHLGDTTLWKQSQSEQLERIIQKLNGRHILILGNHDRMDPFKYHQIGFEHVHTALEITIEGTKLVLFHDPTWAHSVQEDVDIIAGHVHTMWKSMAYNSFGFKRAVINVGVDVWDYRPVPFETVLAEIQAVRNQAEAEVR